MQEREISPSTEICILLQLIFSGEDIEKDVNTVASISMSKLEEVILMAQDQVNSFFPMCFHVYTFCIRIERENGVERQEEIYCTCICRKGKLN
jgi:hypothetical protein